MAATAALTRARWAVGVLDPGPADALLEVGCGLGLAAALVLSTVVRSLTGVCRDIADT